jgi:hypothetical protein
MPTLYHNYSAMINTANVTGDIKSVLHDKVNKNENQLVKFDSFVWSDVLLNGLFIVIFFSIIFLFIYG